MYSDIVKDHFSQPRNIGELAAPDAIGLAQNKADGDQVQLHIQIEDGIITDVKMKVMGCVAAIAATSLYTEMIKDKTIQDALEVSKETLTGALGGLPDQKIKCSLTCIDAFHSAIKKYHDQNT